MDACTVEMSDHKPCGRRLYARTAVAPLEGTCLMHYPGTKPAKDFQAEVDALIARKSERNTLGVADFKGFHIPGGVDFCNRVFPDVACFMGAVFHEPVKFSGARFTQDVSFVQATFSAADFSSAVFEGNGIFPRATFGREVDFSGAAFRRTADFREARFGSIAAFGRSELNCPAFESSVFVGNVSFIAAKLSGDANFRNVTFRSQVNCFHSVFSGPADFSFAKCLDTASFSQATLEAANFDSAEFSKSADFGQVLARRHAAFQRTKFQGVTFESAHLYEGASFDSATFSGDVEFRRATFGPLPDDSSAARGAAIADFTGAKFEKPTAVWFSQVNKDAGVGLRARFLNCDVEQIHLDDVHWHRRRGGRMVLQDELDVVEGRKTVAGTTTECRRSEHELVAIAYRQLINNFDKVRALDLAEDCFCGAMEMKRLDPNQTWLSRTVLSAYKIASSYGSSYVQAFFVLVAIVIAASVIFATPWLGLGPAQGNPGAVQMASSWLRRYPAGLFHSLEVATFQRDAVYYFAWRRGRLMVIAEQTLVPIQVALLLLALRRRFRR